MLNTLPLITYSDFRREPNPMDDGCVGRKKGDEYFTKEKKSLKNLLFIFPLLYVEKLIFLLPPFNLVLCPLRPLPQPSARCCHTFFCLRH